MTCPRCGAVVHYRTARDAAIDIIGAFLAIGALALLGSTILWLLVSTWREIL